MHQDPIWAPGLIPTAPLPIQFPACGLGKQSRTAQSLGTLHPHERPQGASGSWLWIGSAPAVAAAWGVNHRTEDLSLRLSSSLYICLSNKNKTNFFLKRKGPNLIIQMIKFHNTYVKRMLLVGHSTSVN